MHVNTFKYAQADVVCRHCTKYAKKHGCTTRPCPWLAERVEASAMDYGDVILETFSHSARLLRRLNPLIHSYPGTMWRDEQHRQHMEALKARLGYSRRRDTPSFYAAMYLLTSSEDIYQRSANCFCKHGLEFEYALLRGISPHDYTLLSAARDIYSGTGSITFGDLSDTELIDAEAFRLIIHALLISRYGPTVLVLREKSVQFSGNPVAERER